MISIHIINQSKHPLPAYETVASAGMDLRANINEIILLQPMQRMLVPTGLFIALQEGMEAQIRPRSGLAFKNGITILNSPGTIDADYRGEVKVLLINLSETPFEIKDGDRIAQLVIAKFEHITWNVTSELPETNRGSGGFGSTGK